jgi:hypothetical protein
MGHVQAALLNRSGTGTDFAVTLVGGFWGFCTRGAASHPLVSVAESHFESQADLLALGYMTHAGYDPQALVTVFERWTGSRVDEEVKSKARAVASSTIYNTSAFDGIKARLAPLPRRVPTLYK